MQHLLTYTTVSVDPITQILAGTIIIMGMVMVVMKVYLHEAREEKKRAIDNAIFWTDNSAKWQKMHDELQLSRNAIEDELTAAKSELEFERVMFKLKSDSRNYWKSKSIQECNEIEQWKTLYTEQLNRANRFEELHAKMTKRPRDPKTGRIISKSKA